MGGIADVELVLKDVGCDTEAVPEPKGRSWHIVVRDRKLDRFGRHLLEPDAFVASMVDSDDLLEGDVSAVGAIASCAKRDIGRYLGLEMNLSESKASKLHLLPTTISTSLPIHPKCSTCSTRRHR